MHSRSPFLPIFLLVCLFIANLSTAQIAPCWAFNMDNNEPPQPFNKPYISQILNTSDGFVVFGTSNEQIFPSRDNNKFGRTNFGGPYIAKYDFGGNLKWIDYGVDSDYAASLKDNRSTISAAATDNNGNIYICGTISPKHRFYYNNGNSSARISAIDTNAAVKGFNYFIAKISKTGNILWQSSINGEPALLTYDNNGRIVITGKINGTNFLYVHNVDTSKGPDAVGTSVNYYVCWVDTLGNCQKQALYYDNNTGALPGQYGMASDSKGNIYIASSFQGDVTFYSDKKTNSHTCRRFGFPTSPAMFIVKFDSSSTPLWTVRNPGCYVSSIAVGANDNIFAATYQNIGAYSSVFVNRDSSYVYNFGIRYKLYSISKDGFLNWCAEDGLIASGQIALTDTSISVIGFNPRKASFPVGQDTFKSADKTKYLYLKHRTPNLVIVTYDTTGTPVSVRKTGESADEKEYLANIKLIHGNDSSFILAGDVSNLYVDTPLIFKNDTLKLNDIDGFVVKYTPGICDTTQTAVVKGLTSTQFDPHIYPNPSSGRFFIKSHGDAKIDLKVYNSTGTVVHQESIILGSAGKQVDISYLHNGYYIVELRSVYGAKKIPFVITQ